MKIILGDDVIIGATRFDDWLRDSGSQQPAQKAAPARALHRLREEPRSVKFPAIRN